MTSNPLIGKWSYRSFYNIADLNTDLDKLEPGNGTIDIREVTPRSSEEPLVARPGNSTCMARLAMARRCRWHFRAKVLSEERSGFMVISAGLSLPGQTVIPRCR
jgi:hypothetical protein